MPPQATRPRGSFRVGIISKTNPIKPICKHAKALWHHKNELSTPSNPIAHFQTNPFSSPFASVASHRRTPLFQ
jgi:hypothetical protein